MAPNHTIRSGYHPSSRLQCIFAIVFTAFILRIGTCFAQIPPDNHPELGWRTISTEHFAVHFHDSAERAASVVARIAEDIYGPVTSLYDHVPDGIIHFIIRDHDDNSNGAAYYYDNKVEIWAPAMDFEFRGTHDWLRNVVTHEFCHMISLGAARRMPRRIPSVYFQYFGYEKEKRPDVIHGYPNRLISVPFAGTVIPLWFAEGMAQVHRSGLNYDAWDTHRDMLLRTAVLAGEALSPAEMSVFGKNSLGNERVYNQGYALTLYLMHMYGEDKLSELVRQMKKPWRMRFSAAAQAVLGKSEAVLYEEWLAWCTTGYRLMEEDLRSRIVGGRLIEENGTGNFYPVFSPDGKRLAYLSNRGWDYLSQTGLYLFDLTSGRKQKIKSSVGSSVSWSPQGDRIVYAKKTARSAHGSHVFDLYTIDLRSKKERRITRGARIRQPDWSPDGRTFVGVKEGGGTTNLVLVSSDGERIRQITAFTEGEQVYSPRWLGKTGKIVFTLASRPKGRDIAVIDSSGRGFEVLIEGSPDARDAFPADTGKSIVYASDRTGVFNLYRRDLETGEERRITRIAGGAFMPAAGPDGGIVYAEFRYDGYKIALIRPEESDVRSNGWSAESGRRISDSGKDAPESGGRSSGEEQHCRSPYDPIRKAALERSLPITRFDDRYLNRPASTPYATTYASLSFLPRVMIDYPGKLKIGSYFYGSDVLDRVSVLGGFAANSQFDTDIFALFEYRRFAPTLFIEAYQQSRFVDEEDVDVRFNLMEVDIGADWKLGDHHGLRTAFIHERYSARLTFLEQGQEFKFAYTYHIGNMLRLEWRFRHLRPSVLSGIAPQRGRLILLRADYAWQRFLNDFVVNQKYGTVVEEFNRFKYGQFFLDWREYLPGLFRTHSTALRVRAGTITRPADSFYHFFAGGLDGLKGYPYYSIEGRNLMHISAAYRIPLFQHMNLQLAFLQFDKLAFSVYGDMGKAWEGENATADAWRRSAGVQLRLGIVSFYSYPMSFFVDAAYGFDRFENRGQTYGQSWRWYLGILFDFLD